MDAVEKIQEAYAKASKGKWFWNSYSTVQSGFYCQEVEVFIEEWQKAGEPSLERLPGKENSWFEKDYEADPVICHVPAHHGDTATGRHANDAIFIEAAHENWPGVYAEIQRLRNRVKELEDGTSNNAG